MKPLPPRKTPALYTANQIAKEINRSSRSVLDCIRRLNIQAKGTTGHFDLYAPEVIETVRSAMRAPNQTEKPITTSTGA
jgi:hypothetical protein